jgi:valyl-tRNA synthetase
MLLGIQTVAMATLAALLLECLLPLLQLTRSSSTLHPHSSTPAARARQQQLLSGELPHVLLQASIPSIMLSPYPTAQQGWSQPELDSQYEQAQAVVAAIRKLRSDYGLTRQRPTVYVACSSTARADVIQALAGDIACLSTSAEVLLLAADAPVPPYSSVAIVDDVVTVHMLLKVGADVW